MRRTWALLAACAAAGCSKSGGTPGATVGTDAAPGASAASQPGLVASPGVPAAAVAAVAGYFASKDCAGRLAFILSPEKNKSILLAYYSDVKTSGCKSTVDKIEGSATDSCDEAKVGSYCFLNVFRDGDPKRTEYELKRTAEGFKIDWRSSVEYSPMSIAAFKAKMPPTPTIFRVWAKLDDYFNFAWSEAKGTHYSIILREPRGDRIHGYIPKALDGERLFEALKDGQEHTIMVAVQHRAGGESDMVDIKKVVRLDWRESPDEP